MKRLTNDERLEQIKKISQQLEELVSDYDIGDIDDLHLADFFEKVDDISNELYYGANKLLK